MSFLLTEVPLSPFKDMHGEVKLRRSGPLVLLFNDLQSAASKVNS